MNTTALSLSFGQIAPLLETAQLHGGLMACVFRCPATKSAVEATAVIQRDQSSLKGRSAHRVRSGLLQAGIRPLRTAIARHLGRGPLSRLVGDVLTDAAVTATSSVISGPVREATILEAFRSVEERFERCATTGQLRIRPAIEKAVADAPR